MGMHRMTLSALFQEIFLVSDIPDIQGCLIIFPKLDRKNISDLPIIALNG